VTSIGTTTPIKKGSVAMRLLDTEGAPLAGPDADMWRTAAAWLWTTYLMLVTGAVLYWVF
jgi:hypothetical protein